MRKPLTIKNGFAFFWRQWPANWEYSPFTIDNIEYNCVEQYMMAEKARLFKDDDALKKIMDATNPRDQKHAGRAVKGYIEDTWVKARYDVVLKATIEKYRQNPELRRMLLETHDLKFVEASPYDKVWGIGMAEDHPDIGDPDKWQGQNLLGKAIDEARDVLVKEFGHPYNRG